MQPLEVDIAAVHDVEGAGLGYQQVEHIDVVQFAVADVQERGTVAAQVQKRMQLDGSLMAALVERNGAQGNTARHRSMVLASNA